MAILQNGVPMNADNTAVVVTTNGGASFSSTPTTLLTNAAATGSAVAWGGGDAEWAVWGGTWSGATATLQGLLATGVWSDVVGATLTANGSFIVSLTARDYRVAISGGPPTDLSSDLRRAG